MSLLITFEECKHAQFLMEPGEPVPAAVPSVTYPLIVEHPVDPGDHMTCITCDETRTVRTAE